MSNLRRADTAFRFIGTCRHTAPQCHRPHFDASVFRRAKYGSLRSCQRSAWATASSLHQCWQQRPPQRPPCSTEGAGGRTAGAHPCDVSPFLDCVLHPGLQVPHLPAELVLRIEIDLRPVDVPQLWVVAVRLLRTSDVLLDSRPAESHAVKSEKARARGEMTEGGGRGAHRSAPSSGTSTGGSASASASSASSTSPLASTRFAFIESSSAVRPSPAGGAAGTGGALPSPALRQDGGSI